MYDPSRSIHHAHEIDPCAVFVHHGASVNHHSVAARIPIPTAPTPIMSVLRFHLSGAGGADGRQVAGVYWFRTNL